MGRFVPEILPSPIRLIFFNFTFPQISLPETHAQSLVVTMEVKFASVFLFPLLLLLAKDGMSSTMTDGGGALRRYREVRDHNGIVFPKSTSRERRRRNQSTYILNGRRYLVKKERQCSHETINTENAKRDSSPTNGKKDDARGSNNPSKNKRDPLFLDASKRQAFREYHRLGLHLR